MSRQAVEPVRRNSSTHVGRDRELRQLSELLDKTCTTSVVCLHGVAGIGKSTVLDAFAASGTRSNVAMVRLDCRMLEPTETGFLDALAVAVGSDDPTLAGATARCSALASVVILTLDNYEVFRLVDTWLRQSFIPSLPSNTRVILAGREPLVAAWLISPELEGAVRSIPLGPLDEESAIDLFRRYDVPEQSARRLNRIVRGHPLAIKLAASTIAERSDLALEDVAAHRAVEELTKLYLSEVDDEATRRALEASACVRRITRSLLEAMLPDLSSAVALESLAQLPFVEGRSDGLIVHEAVREAVANSLRSSDPERYRQYRRAAWRQLKGEVKEVGVNELWRYTSDMLYMIENPVVREAFFPSAAQPLATEPAYSGDLPAIEEISEKHDGRESSELLRAWWNRAPESFSVIRDRDGVITGFFYLLDTSTMVPPKVKDDPVTESWWRHLRDYPVPKGQLVLGFRRWLDLDRGEAPCPSQAASWLDVKRTYMQLRPNLRRIYVAVEDAGTYWPIVEKLGFLPLSEPTLIGDRSFTSVVLDFGPGSVDGWLSGLVASELGVGNNPFDEAAREVAINGHRASLTPLEFGVLRCLDANQGHAVSREHLLREVWGYEFSGESNVVNMAIKALRDKFGARGGVIETIRGVGYRLPDGWRDQLV